jgi:hypothetical protein
MGRIISDRIDYGAAEHVKSVVFGAVGLQYSESFGDVVADKLGIGARLRFSMQSAITVVGFGSAILTSRLALARITRTHLLNYQNGIDRPPTDPASTSVDLGKAATRGARDAVPDRRRGRACAAELSDPLRRAVSLDFQTLRGVAATKLARACDFAAIP